MRTLDKRGILYAVAAQRCVTASAACRAIELASHDSSSDPCSRPWQRADRSEPHYRETKIARPVRLKDHLLAAPRSCVRAARGLSIRASAL